jgi:hypothetical protein
MSNWTYKEKEFASEDILDYYGYVYIIENLITHKQYVGKKLFYSQKTKTVKGKRKKYKIESEWKDYYGSNLELMVDVEKLGPENFKREIIHLCKSKGECSYLEAKEQFCRGVMESDNFYNGWIMVRVRKSHLKKYIDRINNETID